MARRRHTRRRRHHRGFGVLYKLLSVVVISAAIVVALTLFFKVDSISVSGTTRYSSEEIIAASGVKIGDNLFLLNKYEISDAIRDQLPYVSSISISRKLPDTLVIEVTDGTLGGVIQQGSEYWIISSTGKILGKQSEPGSGAEIKGMLLYKPKVGAEITAVEGEERKMAQLIALLAALDEKGMLQGCKGLDFSKANVISMEYADRFTVKFSYDADFAYKLSALNQIVEKLEADGDLRPGTIDFTIDDGKYHFIPA